VRWHHQYWANSERSHYRSDDGSNTHQCQYLHRADRSSHSERESHDDLDRRSTKDALLLHTRYGFKNGLHAVDRLEGLTIVLAGGHGVAMAAFFGLPHSNLLSQSRRK
jgi:hypothetical protein